MASVNNRVPTRTNYVPTTTQQPTNTKETSTANTVTGVATSVPTPTANCRTYTANAPQTKQVTTGTPTNAPAETPSVSTTASAVKTPTSTSSVTTVSTTNAPSTSYLSPMTIVDKVVREDIPSIGVTFLPEIQELRSKVVDYYNSYRSLTIEISNCQREIDTAYSRWKTKYEEYTKSEYRLTLKQAEELENLQSEYEAAVNKGMALKKTRDVVYNDLKQCYDRFMAIMDMHKSGTPQVYVSTGPTPTGPTDTSVALTNTVATTPTTAGVPYYPTAS